MRLFVAVLSSGRLYMSTTALIAGIAGEDGTHLTECQLGKGYLVPAIGCRKCTLTRTGSIICTTTRASTTATSLCNTAI